VPGSYKDKKSELAAIASLSQLTFLKFGDLDRGYSGGLRAFCALADLELDSLILLEGAEAAALDLGVMNEDVIRTAIGGDEAEALFAVEPFHSSLCHIKVLLSFFLQNA
jgi:hypothetical protein